MPDTLASYLVALDAASVTALQNRDIVAEFGQLAQQLEAGPDPEAARPARIEQEVLAASKSLDDKISFHISGMRQDAQGNEESFGWPDTSGYGEAEYTYLKHRFQATGNLYLKSEYGLFLYLRKQAGRPEEVAALVQVLFELSQQYFTLEATEDASKHYVLYAVQTLALAFRIATSRQRDPAVATFLPVLVDYIVATQQRWNASRTGTPMLLGTFTSLVAEQLTLFQEAGRLPDFLARNRQLIDELSASYRYGAMELAQATANVARQAKLDARPWQLLVAELYEKLAEEAEASGNSAAVSFTQQGLRLYQELGEAVAVERLNRRYQQLRTSFGLNTVVTEVPAAHARAQAAEIQQQVAQSTEAQIVLLVAATPMFATIQSVRDYEETAAKSFADFFPTTVEDKHGNPVQIFATEEEKQQFRILNAYGMLGQLGTQTLVQLMLAAYKAGKLNQSGVMAYLADSWLGQPRPVREHGVTSLTHPLRLLESGIRIIFQELNRWREGETDDPDFIAAIDSLVLKVEYILRYMCDLLGIATFRPKKDGIVHEKLLEELLRDLTPHLDPEDLFFVRFHLHEKAGQNLRNRVAHGLLDDNEYGVEKAFLILSVLLKLASYEFKPREYVTDNQ
ncbi:DUF4209 domain-containing protein [Hymenobacter sp.]|uniref:DUF4209 domain-containing protein n=1 Tax=Hymenobacter sp. TaxID=1898978 RepID=UPI00286A3FA6|nr:DUF4209 domain-containing protein [Hymenobacter sp.]